MQWCSVLSTNSKLDKAIAETSALVKEQLGSEPDLILVFVSVYYHLHFDRLPEVFRREFKKATIIGCSARGVIANGRELEEDLGLAVIAAKLPDVQLDVTHLNQDALADIKSGAVNWKKELAVDSSDANNLNRPNFVLISDPTSFDSEDFLEFLNKQLPEAQVIGGLASGTGEVDFNAIFVNDQVYKNGAALLTLKGDIQIDSLVAHSSRPIGSPMFVTQARDTAILKLDGLNAEEVVGELVETLSEADRNLFDEGALIGISVPDEQERKPSGEYLMRKILGIDSATGAIITDFPVPEHTVVQIHVRDADISHDILLDSLKKYEEETRANRPSGALLFSCTGRGEDFYHQRDHETIVFKECMGSIPMGGFFCQGEVGRMNSKAQLHGYVSSFGFFRPALPKTSQATEATAVCDISQTETLSVDRKLDKPKTN